MRQAMRLESTDTDTLTALIGDVQEKLAVESIAHAVSDGVRWAVEERLIATAIRQFRTRAEQVAHEFGPTGYNVVNTNINTRGAKRPPMVFARGSRATWARRRRAVDRRDRQRRNRADRCAERAVNPKKSRMLR